MLVEFDFSVTRAAYVKAAMEAIASFHPDGLTAAEVQVLVVSAAPVRASYVTRLSAIEAGRALRHTAIEVLHAACVDFLAQARSRFRKDAGLMERLGRLPVQDQTFQETLTRAAASAALWAALPLVGSPPVAFAVGQGATNLTQTGFLALSTAAQAADAAIPGTDMLFQQAEAAVHQKLAELEDFVVAALELGRSQYDEGSPERELIDAIPTVNTGGNGGSGGGGSSSSSSGDPVEPPEVPADVAAVAGGVPGEVEATCGAAARAAYYHWRVFDAAGVQIGLIQQSTGPENSFSELPSGTTVTVTVLAGNAGGQSAQSEPVAVAVP